MFWDTVAEEEKRMKKKGRKLKNTVTEEEKKEKIECHRRQVSVVTPPAVTSTMPSPCALSHLPVLNNLRRYATSAPAPVPLLNAGNVNTVTTLQSTTQSQH
jgi:hypothetical protein